MIFAHITLIIVSVATLLFPGRADRVWGLLIRMIRRTGLWRVEGDLNGEVVQAAVATQLRPNWKYRFSAGTILVYEGIWTIVRVAL